MELKSGYKQSEIGVALEDWETRKLGDLFCLKNGYAFSSDFFSDSGPILLTPGNFKLEGGLYFNERNTKRYSGKFDASMTLSKGDLLIVMTDLTPGCNLLGKPAFVRTSDLILHNQRIGKVLLKETKIDQDYLFHVLLSRQYLSAIKDLATGSTVRHTSNKSIYSINVSVPPFPEQRAIAAALSNVDALIASLDKLIAKKRDIKQAGMQQLLTGKTRLPNFKCDTGYKRTDLGEMPSSWRCVLIPEVTIRSPDSIKIGPFGSALKKEYLTKEGYKVYGQENVFKKNLTTGNRYISKERFRQLTSFEIRPGDFLISMMGTVGRCMVATETMEPGIMDSHLLRLRLDQSKVIPEYLLQLFATRVVMDQVKQLSVGGIMEGLSSKIVRNICLPLPMTHEQSAIANALYDMDADIAALELRLDKVKQIKQGMMQELLTGRIRLL